MNPLLLLAIGAVVLIASSSSSDTKPAPKKEEGDGLLIPGTVVKPGKPKTPGKPVGGLQGQQTPGPELCGTFQYWDAKLNKCVDFWKEGETDELVKQRIFSEVKKIYNNPDVGKKKIPELCDDTWQGDAEQVVGTWIANPKMINVVKNTIVALWPTVTLDALPPNDGSPKWLWTIWNKTIQIYSQIICMNP